MPVDERDGPGSFGDEFEHDGCGCECPALTGVYYSWKVILICYIGKANVPNSLRQ